MAKKPSQSNAHRGIPKDAGGKPHGIWASYERRMRNCEAAWAATGDPLVVDEAQTHRQPHPSWLHEAIGQKTSGKPPIANASQGNPGLTGS
jgi:hypothetical protein